MTSDEFELFYSPIQSFHSPDISVVISTYNRCRKEGECASLLKRALDSILNQTYKKFELILIDDCSNDSTKDYCKKIALDDPRVKFFHFKKNSGVPAKRYNFGISVSAGRYITFMFDDDEWELNALQDLYEGISGKHKRCAMVYGLATFYRGNDYANAIVLGEKWSWNKIHEGNFISNNSVIIKRKAIDLVGGYDEDAVFLRVCDWDLWWRIGRKFKVGRIKQKVSIVYSELADSIGMTKILDWEQCKKKQKGHRKIPLQFVQKEPFYCKIHAIIFDFYVAISQKLSIKKRIKNILPKKVCKFLKHVKNTF